MTVRVYMGVTVSWFMSQVHNDGMKEKILDKLNTACGGGYRMSVRSLKHKRRQELTSLLTF